MCKKQCGIQKRRPNGHEKDRVVSSEANHCGTHTIALHNKGDSISERKPKIKWSKSSEEAKYKKFDDEVSASLQRRKDTVKLAEVICDEVLKRFGFGLENDNLPSRREKKGDHL